MEDSLTPKENEEVKKPRQFRGLYEHVHISVRTLDIIIVSCIAIIVVLLMIDMRNPGFTVTFDSKGGTDVAAQNRMYGQLLEPPEPPTREGYRFIGWFRDPACDELWVLEVDKVQQDMTLYAGWEAK